MFTRFCWGTLVLLLAVTLVGCAGDAAVIGSRTLRGRGATPTPTRSIRSAPTATAVRAQPTPTATRGRTGPTATTARATSTPTNATSSSVPNFSHIYVIVLENKEYSQIVGSASAPYLNSLIKQYGLATNYYALTHPSEPNYIAMASGSTQGVSDDKTHNLSATNLADQLEAHGKTWRVFAQNVPTNCYTGDTASGGPDGSGTYVRRHDPFISFTDISGNPTRCAHITDFSHFSASAANFEYIVPNLTNDMHDGSIAQGDAFLKSFVPKIINSSAFQNSVLFITWDEGTTNAGGGGHIATLVISPRTPAGTTSNTYYTHYALLRTIEDAWGLGCLANACSASDMRALFK